MTTYDREDLIMKAVLKSLIDLGGIAERKDIKRDIYDNSTLIPEDYIDYTSKSKQTGNEYKPFNYQFNFLKILEKLKSFFKLEKSLIYSLT